MTRILKVTYAGLTIGKDQADASYNLTDKYRVASSYSELSVEFEVVVASATRATFLAAEAALLAAYRKPDQALEVVLGSTARHDLDPADNSGFNARASCVKVGGVEDTANSARYRCSVVVQLPADLTGRSGRQSSEVSVEVTPAGKRTVTISGAYTALSANSASDQYASAVSTFCSGILTGIGGTYNLLPEQYAYDDQDKVLRFRRVYEEVFLAESQGGTDHAAIKGQQLVIERLDLPADGDWSFDVQPLQQLRATFGCYVDSAQTTDLRSLWEDTILPHIRAQAAALTGGTLVVVRAAPSFDLAENRIAAVLELAGDVGGAFFQADVDVFDDVDLGVRLVPVWDGLPYSRDRYDVQQRHAKTVDRSVTFSGEGRSLQVPAFQRFVLVGRSTTTRRTRVGRPGDYHRLTVVRDIFRYERADIRQVAAAGGGTRARVQDEDIGGWETQPGAGS